MKVTVATLKKIIHKLDDNVILATLGGCGNRNFKPYSGIKRFLLLKGENEKVWGGETFLTVNATGTHFTGEDEQKGLKVIGHFDESNFQEEEIVTEKHLLELGFEKEPIGYSLDISYFDQEYKTLTVDLGQGIAVRYGEKAKSRIHDELISIYNVDLHKRITLPYLKQLISLLKHEK